MMRKESQAQAEADSDLKDQHQFPHLPADLQAALDSPPPMPNSRKKRTKMPDFTRAERTPSREDRIRNIFEDAAAELQTPFLSSPSRWPLSRKLERQASEASRSRILLSEVYIPRADSQCLFNSIESSPHDSDVQLPASKFGISEIDQHPASRSLTPSQGTNCLAGTPACEPISSGFNSPTPQSQPMSNHLGPGYTFYGGPDDEDKHSTHGVELILPVPEPEHHFHEADNVKQWLNTVTHLRSGDIPSEALITPPLSQPSNPSNKENIPPSGFGESHYSDMAESLSTNSDFASLKAPDRPQIPGPKDLPRRLDSWSLNHKRLAEKRAMSSPPIKPLSTSNTPQRLLEMPPRRKNLSVSIQSNQRKPDIHTGGGTENRGGGEDGPLRELSPSVTRFRKGKGPITPMGKRCASYLDRDILAVEARQSDEAVVQSVRKLR